MFRIYWCREASFERAIFLCSQVEFPSHLTPGFERSWARQQLRKQCKHRPTGFFISNQDRHLFAAQRSERYRL